LFVYNLLILLPIISRNQIHSNKPFSCESTEAKTEELMLLCAALRNVINAPQTVENCPSFPHHSSNSACSLNHIKKHCGYSAYIAVKMNVMCRAVMFDFTDT